MSARSFKVPILLPLDPAAAMEAVTKQYVDARVITPPAKAGARPDSATIALFSAIAAPNNNGFSAAPDGGVDAIYDSAKAFGIFRLTAPSTYTQLARFDDRPRFYANPLVISGSAALDIAFRDNNSRTFALYAQGEQMFFYDSAYGNAGYFTGQAGGHKFYCGGVFIGTHPAHGTYRGLWISPSGGEAAGNYFVISSDNGGIHLINSANETRFRIANGSDLIIITANQIKTEKQMYCRTLAGAPTNVWDGSNLVVDSQSGQCRIAINSPGVAPMTRVMSSEGENWILVNNPNTAYASYGGAAYIVKSSADVKEAIRPLRRQRERIVVKHEPLEDKVEDVDIMGLRPIIYRPKVGATKVLEDGTSAEWEPDTIFGRQGKRERLGLIADEVQHVLPTAVFHNIDGEPWGIYYEQVVVALLDHVQRLTETVETLRYRVTELEKEKDDPFVN